MSIIIKDYTGETMWYNQGITRKFSDIYSTYESFKTDYDQYDFSPKEIWLGTETDSQGNTRPNNLKNIYYLLLAKHSEDRIAGDEERFKTNLFSLIWQYGPIWQRKLDMQNKLRNISEEDLLKGSQAIYNNALNPDTTPQTDSYEAINFISNQNTTNYKKSKMDAYTQLWDLLRVDVTTEFLNKFNKLFSFLATQYGTEYISEED